METAGAAWSRPGVLRKRLSETCADVACERGAIACRFNPD